MANNISFAIKCDMGSATCAYSTRNGGYMKKLIKLLLAVGAIIGGVVGVLYFLDKRKNEDLEDFDDDDFDDIFQDDDDDRDYVTLDLEEEDTEENEKEEEAKEDK